MTNALSAHANRNHRSVLAGIALAALGALGTSTALAGEPAKSLAKPIIEEELGLSVHGLIQLEFSDHYITPRGLNVENQGVVFQPLVLLFWNLYSGEGFLKDITLTTGVWNSIHSRRSGADPGRWNEIDPIGGLTFKLGQGWKFDAFITQFHSQTESYDTSTNLDFKLTYNDSCFGNFSINPYVEFFLEVEDKATVVFNSATSQESWYFVLGVDPTYKFQSIPLTVELPTFISFVDSDFYQRFDGSGGGSGAGVFSTYLKFSTPLSFVPKRFGAWTLYAGVQYYHLFNDGVLDGNQVLGATSERKENLWQVHGGVSVFF
jgi:hypothetical protein